MKISNCLVCYKKKPVHVTGFFIFHWLLNDTVVYRTFALAVRSVAHKYGNHILVGLTLHALAAC